MNGQDWTPEQVMEALRAQGTNLARLARQYGCTRQAMYQTLTAPNHRGQLRIAHALGVHPMTIWPSRYRPDGEPARRRFELKPAPKCNAPAPAVNVNVKAGA